MLRTHTLEHASDLRRFSDLWNKLFSSGHNTIFQRLAWNETAARVFGTRERPQVIVVENDHGAAIVTACQTAAGVGLLGERLFDYRDVLCSDPAILANAWERIAAMGSPFELTALRGDAATTRWQPLSPSPFANAPAVLRGSISEEQFLRTHNRLGRHSRRIRKHGISFQRHRGTERDLVRAIYERKGAQGAAEANLFNDSLRREFMQEICGHPEVQCEVFTYETPGDLVAALVTFRDGSWRRFYTVYYDQRWASLSPGQVLLFEVTAESLAQGLECDFMTGEYPYKIRLATDRVPLYQVSATAQDLARAATGRLTSAILAA